MSNIKKSFVFIVETDEGDLLAGRQKEVDGYISEYENAGIDLDFKVIGRIPEPNGPFTLPIDFNENLIEWYEADEEGTRDKEFMKRAVAAITKLLI